MRLRVLTVGVVAALLGVGTGVAHASADPIMVSHAVTSKSNAGGTYTERSRTVVTKLKGLPAPAAKRVVADLNRRSHAIVSAPVPRSARGSYYEWADTQSVERTDGFYYFTIDQNIFTYDGRSAHTTNDQMPLTYLSATGKLLTIRDFARPGKLQALVDRLSVVTRALFKKDSTPKADYWAGTTPQLAHFVRFVPSESGWTVVFPASQVAPSPADPYQGATTLQLSWAQLGNLVVDLNHSPV